jgi:hypothetical protein
MMDLSCGNVSSPVRVRFLGLNAPFFVADDPRRNGCSVLFLTCIIANRIEKSKTGHIEKDNLWYQSECGWLLRPY